MKKSIKIILIMLFVMLTFGITTSKALTVTSSTSKSDLINALKDRETLYLNDHSYAIMRNNPNIFCRQKGGILSDYSTKYNYSSIATYPGNFNNGDEIAFVFGYGMKEENGFEKDDIQDAYWYWLDYPNPKVSINGLAKRAKAYGEFKDSEKTIKSNYGNNKNTFIVSTDNAKTTTSGDNLVYGPIKIYYSYASCTIEEKTFSLGGFDFSFSGSSSITDSNVTLCQSKNSKYERIDSSTKGKIRTSSYSGKDLYICVDINAIKESKIKINFTYYTAEATAELYLIEGTANFSGTKTDYCMDCQYEIQSAIELTGTTNTSVVIKHKGLYWKYKSHTIISPDANGNFIKYKFDGYSDYNITATASVASTSTFYYCCGNRFNSVSQVYTHWFNNSSTHYAATSGVVQCKLCGGNIGGSTQSLIESHIKTCSQVLKGTTNNYNDQYQYTFSKRNIPCGATMDNGTKCGTSYTYNVNTATQRLAVYSKSSYETSTKTENIEIPLKTSLEVIKKWVDDSNKYGTRPANIEIEVSRRAKKADGNWNDWEVLTEGTHYNLSNWSGKNTNTWKTTITGLDVANSEGKRYQFRIKEKEMSDYYTVSYTSPTETSNAACYITITDTERTVTITNTLSKTQIKVKKIWDDENNKYGFRPSNIELVVWRRTKEEGDSGKPWTKLTQGTDYKIAEWSGKGTNTWETIITDLDIADSQGKKYQFRVAEDSIPHYSPYAESSSEKPNNGITTCEYAYIYIGDTTRIVTITNKLKLVDLEIIKIWDDFQARYNPRTDIKLEISRRIKNGKWEVLEGNYTIKKVNDDIWTTIITDLLEADANGNPYEYRVKELGTDSLIDNGFVVEYSVRDKNTGNETACSLENGIIISSENLKDKQFVIRNILVKTEIDVTKIWDEQGTNYGTRPSKINLKVERAIGEGDGKQPAENKWELLRENVDYTITWTGTTTNNWKAHIADLEIADENRNRYHFRITEVKAEGTASGSIHYYSPSYETVVNKQDGTQEIKNNNWVRAGDSSKDLTITNTLRLVDLTITKKWVDAENRRNTRPENLQLVVSRSTDNKNWNVVQNANITWSKQGDTWTATIAKLLETDKDGNVYKYKVEEIFEDKRYEISYSLNGAIIDTTKTTNLTITNELQLIDISVTKEWQDFNAFHNGVRPENLDLEVYRSIDGKTWEGPLKVENDYDRIVWSKNGNTWTAKIENLLEKDYNGNVYKYQVREKQTEKYYNVKYSSGNYTDGNVENNQITILNELKYIDLEFTKEWKNFDESNVDYANEYNLRPDKIELLVYRSTDNKTWEGPLKPGKGNDYDIQWVSTGANDDTWTAKISKLVGANANGQDYYFKVEEKALEYYEPVYGDSIKYDNNKWINEDFAGRSESLTIKNKLKKIDINGYVWLDGQTGIKPAVGPNGLMDNEETKLANIVVHLMWKKPQYLGGQTVDIAQTVTDNNGYYEFKDVELGNYYVEFDYDGIHYEDTIEGKDSIAFENEQERNTFNRRFQTITYKKSNDGTTLNYEYSDKKSTLITTNADGTVAADFEMNARTEQTFYTEDIANLNLGLVKRGTDIALSTDVKDAEVTINGNKTTYKYNKEENSIEIEKAQTSENVSYTLNLYKSDYYYRIRDYVSNDTFKENDYINDGTPSGAKTGEELKVYVKYELNLQNQSTENVKINEVKYTFDEKYTFKQIVDGSYATTQNGNVLTINLNGVTLQEGETKTIHLLFEVINDNGLKTGDFSNKAEITSYSTDEGFIDIDSQPGNFVNNNQPEDDSDTAGGLKITMENDFIRKIEGKVFDNDNNQNVDDVIVQLIELKEVNGKVYEYIWQETVSGEGKGLRLNNDGSALEEYTYSKEKGKYEFSGFIPGDYIVRFIYGDGTTYDMTESVIKYNGQDYKSMKDSNYNAEWYNSSTYSNGASVARDNEARRLETMAYSVNIDAEKGVLLKLLNNVKPEKLNATEKEIIKTIAGVTEVNQDVINTLLKEQVLKNTWMCAETSKIKIAVDTEDIKNISSATQVTAGNTYVSTISNVNLGLELRPATQIELKKYITGLKVTTSNGQTLANAYMDFEEAKAYAQNHNTTMNDYLRNPSNLKGIKDNITILPNGTWMYDGVSPTEVNTILDGANLEFTYVLVIENTSEEDYLSTTLIDTYKASSDIETYKTLLSSKANEIKGNIRDNGYNTNIGNIIGHNYYIGGNGQAKVLTNVTNIRDYVNNDLSFVVAGDKVSEDAGPITHRTLRDDYSLQPTTINTILKTASTGPMSIGSSEVMYNVTLSKNPISSTGNLYFDNYIAEVMSFTNAAGRRSMTSTPGNAEIVDEYPNASVGSHEIDEASAADINLNASTGENRTIIYIVITAIGISTIAAGAFVVKKYVIR